MMIRVSSAYYNIGKSEECWRGIGRFSRPCLFAMLVIDYKRSATNTNNRGDRGSPCLTLLLQWKTFPRVPFKSTEEVPVLKISFI